MSDRLAAFGTAADCSTVCSTEASLGFDACLPVLPEGQGCGLLKRACVCSVTAASPKWQHRLLHDVLVAFESNRPSVSIISWLLGDSGRASTAWTGTHVECMPVSVFVSEHVCSCNTLEDN